MKTTPCPQCGNPTIQGWTTPPGAYTVRLDATRITHQTELACVIIGITTYTIDHKGKINKRRPAAIIHKASQLNTHPEHICGQTLPPAPPPPTYTQPDHCPY